MNNVPQFNQNFPRFHPANMARSGPHQNESDFNNPRQFGAPSFNQNCSWNQSSGPPSGFVDSYYLQRLSRYQAQCQGPIGARAPRVRHRQNVETHTSGPNMNDYQFRPPPGFPDAYLHNLGLTTAQLHENTYRLYFLNFHTFGGTFDNDGKGFYPLSNEDFLAKFNRRSQGTQPASSTPTQSIMSILESMMTIHDPTWMPNNPDTFARSLNKLLREAVRAHMDHIRESDCMNYLAHRSRMGAGDEWKAPGGPMPQSLQTSPPVPSYPLEVEDQRNVPDWGMVPEWGVGADWGVGPDWGVGSDVREMDTAFFRYQAEVRRHNESLGRLEQMRVAALNGGAIDLGRGLSEHFFRDLENEVPQISSGHLPPLRTERPLFAIPTPTDPSEGPGTTYRSPPEFQDDFPPLTSTPRSQITRGPARRECLISPIPIEHSPKRLFLDDMHHFPELTFVPLTRGAVPVEPIVYHDDPESEESTLVLPEPEAGPISTSATGLEEAETSTLVEDPTAQFDLESTQMSGLSEVSSTKLEMSADFDLSSVSAGSFKSSELSVFLPIPVPYSDISDEEPAFWESKIRPSALAICQAVQIPGPEAETEVEVQKADPETLQPTPLDFIDIQDDKIEFPPLDPYLNFRKVIDSGRVSKSNRRGGERKKKGIHSPLKQIPAVFRPFVYEPSAPAIPSLLDLVLDNPELTKKRVKSPSPVPEQNKVIETINTNTWNTFSPSNVREEEDVVARHSKKNPFVIIRPPKTRVDEFTRDVDLIQVFYVDTLKPRILVYRKQVEFKTIDDTSSGDAPDNSATGSQASANDESEFHSVDTTAHDQETASQASNSIPEDDWSVCDLEETENSAADSGVQPASSPICSSPSLTLEEEAERLGIVFHHSICDIPGCKNNISTQILVADEDKRRKPAGGSVPNEEKPKTAVWMKNKGKGKNKTEKNQKKRARNRLAKTANVELPEQTTQHIETKREKNSEKHLDENEYGEVAEQQSEAVEMSPLQIKAKITGDPSSARSLEILSKVKPANVNTTGVEAKLSAIATTNAVQLARLIDDTVNVALHDDRGKLTVHMDTFHKNCAYCRESRTLGCPACKYQPRVPIKPTQQSPPGYVERSPWETVPNEKENAVAKLFTRATVGRVKAGLIPQDSDASDSEEGLAKISNHPQPLVVPKRKRPLLSQFCPCCNPIPPPLHPLQPFSTIELADYTKAIKLSGGNIPNMEFPDLDQEESRPPSTPPADCAKVPGRNILKAKRILGSVSDTDSDVSLDGDLSVVSLMEITLDLFGAPEDGYREALVEVERFRDSKFPGLALDMKQVMKDIERMSGDDLVSHPPKLTGFLDFMRAFVQEIMIKSQQKSQPMDQPKAKAQSLTDEKRPRRKTGKSKVPLLISVEVEDKVMKRVDLSMKPRKSELKPTVSRTLTERRHSSLSDLRSRDSIKSPAQRRSHSIASESDPISPSKVLSCFGSASQSKLSKAVSTSDLVFPSSQDFILAQSSNEPLLGCTVL